MSKLYCCRLGYRCIALYNSIEGNMLLYQVIFYAGMARVKMSKEESSSQDFVEKRRAALERFAYITHFLPVFPADRWIISCSRYTVLWLPSDSRLP